MVRTELLLTDGQGPLVERFGLFIAPLGIVESPQVVEALGDVGMVRTEPRFRDDQGPLQEWFGLTKLGAHI